MNEALSEARNSTAAATSLGFGNSPDQNAVGQTSFRFRSASESGKHTGVHRPRRNDIHSHTRSGRLQRG